MPLKNPELKIFTQIKLQKEPKPPQILPLWCRKLGFSIILRKCFHCPQHSMAGGSKLVGGCCFGGGGANVRRASTRSVEQLAPNPGKALGGAENRARCRLAHRRRPPPPVLPHPDCGEQATDADPIPHPKLRRGRGCPAKSNNCQNRPMAAKLAIFANGERQVRKIMGSENGNTPGLGTATQR